MWSRDTVVCRTASTGQTRRNRTGRLRFKCGGTRAETRFCLSAKRTSPLKSAGASIQSNTGSRGVRTSGSNGGNAGYTMFGGSVKDTGYPLHSPVFPFSSRASPCAMTFQLESTKMILQTTGAANLPEYRAACVVP